MVGILDLFHYLSIGKPRMNNEQKLPTYFSLENVDDMLKILAYIECLNSSKLLKHGYVNFNKVVHFIKQYRSLSASTHNG